jgi:hypothetical protein
MFITNPRLLRVYEQAQARYRSVIPREDGREFAVTFARDDHEYKISVRLLTEDLYVKVTIPLELVLANHLTPEPRLGNNWYRWVPYTRQRVDETAYQGLSLNGHVTSDGQNIEFYPKITEWFEDTIADMLTQVFDVFQNLRR